MAVTAQTVFAGLAQEFFVPMPEGQLVNSFRGYYASAGNTIDSSISLTPMFLDIIIYYDHWEDGYEADLSNPVQSTTEIWGDGDPSNGMPPGFTEDVLTANSVIRLRNLIDVPRQAAVLRYDGRDRIGVTKPVALTRMTWATNPGSVLAGAIQIQSTLEYGTEFVSPVGQNAPSNAFNEMFERVEICVMAAENGTEVQIDKNADGVFETAVTLNRGESFAADGIMVGARMTASKPVQAHLITGDVNATYESRWFNLFPRPTWDSEYFSPVSTTSANDPACVFLFNPHASAIDIHYQTMSASGTLNVPAGQVIRHEMPQGSGARFYTTGAVPPAFMGLGAVDTDQTPSSNNSSYEWGFTLIPRSNLTGAIKVGYAPGASDQPISGNGSPAWVIAESATRLYVDYDGDLATGPLTDPNGNKYDYHVDVQALQSVRVYDNNDNDQTGLRVYTADGTKITAAWGQDPTAAEAGNPYLDLGYTVLPHPLFFAVKTGTLIQDLNLDGVADRDDIIEYTIIVTNMGIIPVSGVTVRDLMEGNIEYNPGSTTLDGVPVPDDTAPPAATVFPLDEGGINIGTLGVKQSRTLKFTVAVGRQGIDATAIRNLVLVSVIEQDRDEPAEEVTPTRPTPCDVAAITSTPGALPQAFAGQPYAATFNADGRDGPFTFSAGSGALPPGLTLSAAGALSGTPTTPGVYDFTIQTSDQYACLSSAAFQITVLQSVGVGNLVFIDGNDNGCADPGEGVAGVPVELYVPGQTPGIDLPLAETVTGADGVYFFGNLFPGQYVVHIPARAFYPGEPLEGYSAIALGLSGDDDVGQNGLDIGTPEVDGVSSGAVSLAVGSAPTAETGETGYRSADDDDFDAAIDLTIDFGFQRTVGVGNLVFIDANENGFYDYGEGASGVRVELYRADQAPGVDLPLMTQTTDADGVYFFDQLAPGSYRLFIPPSEFGFGRPLWRLLSMPGTSAGDDDQGEKGIDNLQPESNGIMTAIITLQRGSMPTDDGTETGAFNYIDNRNDADFDLTVDFGFAPPDPNEVGAGNLVFVDQNGNGRYDAGEGRDGVLVQLFQAADDPQTATPLAAMTTTGEGVYLFTGLTEGAYFVHIPASQFQTGGALEGLLSVPGAGEDWGLDDDFDENGIDSDEPWITGIRSTIFYLAPGTEPINAWGESGRDAAMDDASDANIDLTIDFGFSVPMGLGNLVFQDLDGNGRADTGEGVAGVTLRIYPAWADPSFDAPLAETVTDGEGRYFFGGLTPGQYFVHVPQQMFVSGAPLHGLVSLAGTQAGDDDAGEKGVDSDFPEIFGISSIWVTLEPGGAPVGAAESGFDGHSDDDVDANVDLTVDFGFGIPASLGDMVFHDVNGDGIHQPDGADGIPGTADDEAGLSNVLVELWSPGEDGVIGGEDDVLVRDGVETAFDGTYLFTKLSPGSYYVVIPASNFEPGEALEALSTASPIRSAADDGVDGDNNGAQPGGRATAAFSPVVTLSAGEADETIDFGFLANLHPLSWPEWQARHSALGDTTPGGDSDGDAFTNLEEFAFGINAKSGLVEREPVRLEIDPVTRQVDVCVDRVTDLAGLDYTLQILHDLSLSPGGWQDVTTLSPAVTHRPDGTEQARYADVGSLPLVADGAGQVRVKLSLDADFNGTPEAVVYSKVLGWSRRVMGTHLQTLGQAHAATTRLSAKIGTVDGNVLDISASLDGGDLKDALEPGVQYYAEIIDGSHAGHRLEVDEAASQGGSLVIDPANARNTLAPPPGSLAGARLALRRHVTLAELAPPALFNATNSTSTADRIMLYDTATGFKGYWLFAFPGAPRWVAQGDATLASQGGMIMEPGRGFFVQPRSQTVTLMLRGEVRAHPFACPLPAGLSFRASGWPLDLSPVQLEMTGGGGFTGAGNAGLADQIQYWRGDATAGGQGYDSCFLLHAGSFQQWVKQGDATLANQNQTPFIKAHRAFFVRSRSGLATWVQPVPWTP